MFSRASIVTFLAAAALTAVPASAMAAEVTCGQADPATGERVTGTLTLRDDSATTKVFRWHNGVKQLYLDYAVTGCTLAARPEDVTFAMNPATKSDGDDFPGDAVAPTPAPSAHRLSVRVAVDTGKLGAGSFSGVAEVGAPGLESAQTPVSASHTSAFWIPVLVAIFGGIWGVVTTVVLGNRASSIELTRTHEVLLVVLGLGVGAFAGLGTWLNQEVWTFWPNAVATAVAGYAAATTGNTLALIKVVSGQADEDDGRERADAARRPAGPPAPEPQPEPAV
jgi:hypothetical protein